MLQKGDNVTHLYRYIIEMWSIGGKWAENRLVRERVGLLWRDNSGR